MQVQCEQPYCRTRFELKHKVVDSSDLICPKCEEEHYKYAQKEQERKAQNGVQCK